MVTTQESLKWYAALRRYSVGKDAQSEFLMSISEFFQLACQPAMPKEYFMKRTAQLLYLRTQAYGCTYWYWDGGGFNSCPIWV